MAAGLPGSVECRRCVSTVSRNTNKEALLPEDSGRMDADGCGGWRGAAAGCGAEAGTLITPLIPNESLRTAGAVSNEYDDTALLSGTDLFRSGEGFLCTALESWLHRICVAAGQAVSGLMWLMRRALERREAEPVRSSGREGSEALAGDTYGTG